MSSATRGASGASGGGGDGGCCIAHNRARWCRQREPTGADDDDADGATPLCAFEDETVKPSCLKFSAQKILEFHARGNTYRSFNPRPTDRPLSHIPFLVRPGKLPLLRDLSFLFRSASSPPPLFAAGGPAVSYIPATVLHSSSRCRRTARSHASRPPCCAAAVRKACRRSVSCDV